MATYNLGNTGVVTTELPWIGRQRINVIEVTVDLSRRTGLNVPAAGYASGDVLQLADIPANTRVIYASYSILTVEGSAGTVSLGDGGSATRYASAVSTNSATVADAAATTNLYTSADVLKATLGGTLTAAGTAKFRVLLVCVDLNPY